MKGTGLFQCNRCKFNAGVNSGSVRCLLMKKVVYMPDDKHCKLQDSTTKPGKVLRMDEFLKKIKESQHVRN